MSDKIDRKAARYMCDVVEAINTIGANGVRDGWYVSEVRIGIEGEDVYRITPNDFEDYDLSEIPGEGGR